MNAKKRIKVCETWMNIDGVDTPLWQVGILANDGVVMGRIERYFSSVKACEDEIARLTNKYPSLVLQG